MVIDAERPRNRLVPAAHAAAGWSGDTLRETLALLRNDPAASATIQLRDGTGKLAKGAQAGFAASGMARPMTRNNFALADGPQAVSACYASLRFPDFFALQEFAA
ncbi:hypothetical protein [Oceaniglobus trochenteri]|uniref:hypothetical protein n=1 Tax=Oceaniglobus trochenteri TaxID=2763260 RepID=UPI001CFFD325|nr:hypothetical protein [Oceaniglobus trochenteri]